MEKEKVDERQCIERCAKLRGDIRSVNAVSEKEKKKRKERILPGHGTVMEALKILFSNRNFV